MRLFLMLMASLLLSQENLAQVDLLNGLVAHYPFNGSADDVSGNNRHGQPLNGIQLTADRFGNPNSAYLFDGIDDYIRVADPGAFSSPRFSLVLWFQSHTDNLQNLVGKRSFTTFGGTGGAQYQFFINYPPFPGIGSNLVGGNSSCTSISSSSYLNTGDWICRTKWYCAVVTFDGSSHKIYIDGVLKRNETTSFNSFLACNSELRFGNWWQGDLIPFKGIMDDIRWYNRALNQQEVTALYNNFSNISGQCSPNAGAGFLTPDTICINSPLNISNTTIGASSYYWNFCVANSMTSATGTNLGNFNFSMPVFMDYEKEGNNYYGFVTNNMPGKLIRLNFGNSLLNTPTVQDFGNLGGVIPDFCEGIQLVKSGGRWYAIIVGGQPVGRIVKVDFGPSLSNNSPIATNWGNIGNLAYPTDLHVFQDGTNWYGLTINAQTNTITRFSFGSGFINVPMGNNIGNVGGLNYPTGIYAIKKENLWHAFVSNAGNGTGGSSDASLTRLDFGSSLLNTPTGNNIGNPGNLLSSSRDLTIYQACNETFAFVVNNAASKELVKLNFNNSLTSIPTATNVGNVGGLSFPHSISKLFRVENDLYSFVTNVNNNSLTRLKLSGCGTASMPSSTSQNPGPISYNAAGNYSINLTVDDGLPTQSSYCKTVVVIDNTHTPVQSKTFCTGDSVLLTSTKPSGNLWSTGSTSSSIYVKSPGTYWVRSSVGGCMNVDSFVVQARPAPVVNLGADTSFCSLDSLVLNGGNTGANFLWQNGQSTQTFVVKSAGLYHVTVMRDGCTASDSINISILPSPTITITNDTTICKADSVVLNAAGGHNYSWYPLTALSSSSTSSTVAFPDTTTTYYLTVTNLNGCKAEDSVKIFVAKKPLVNIGPDTALCSMDSLLLDAGNPGASYLWQDGTMGRTYFVTEPGLYHVSVNNNGCMVKDSVVVTEIPSPTIRLSPDTVICQTGKAVLAAGGGVSYLWLPGGNLIKVNDSTVIAAPENTSVYYLQVTGQNGCVAKDSVMVVVNPKPVFTATSSRPILCVGDTAILTASGGDRYTWLPTTGLSNPTAATTQAYPTQRTNYEVIIENSTCGMADTIAILLPTANKPAVSVSKTNDIDCFQATAKLSATGGVQYLWHPAVGLSDPTKDNPTVSIQTSTTYHVTITSAERCTATDSIQVVVYKNGDGSGFLVPSAFTPNNDGKNDCFGVPHWGDVKEFSLNVYNRWGEIVFHADKPSQCWNGFYKGVLQPNAVFVYLIKAKTFCGDIFRKGTVTLIR